MPAPPAPPEEFTGIWKHAIQLKLCEMILPEQSLLNATNLLLENLLAPIESKEANATNVNATCEDPAARSLLEARMEESVTSIQARCSALELRIKEQVKFTAKSETNICERFTKSMSAMSNVILESSQELTPDDLMR